MGALSAACALDPANPGAADGYPQATLGFAGGVNRRLNPVLIGDVHGQKPRPLAQLSDECCALLLVQVGDDYGGAGRVKSSRCRRAEARRSAGDQRARALDVHRRPPSTLVTSRVGRLFGVA